MRIGIVGAGGMGTVHFNNYARIAGCRVAALCDPSPLAQKLAHGTDVHVYADLDEMLAQEELDIVDVCTPTFLHKQHVTQALQCGRHVICEKPLALHYEDAKAMYALAEEKGVLLLVGQVLQYAPPSKVLKELVRSGEYGKLLDAQFLRLSACPRWVKNGWLFDKEKSGHIPFDLHIHDLDLIISMLGKPDEVAYTSAGRPGLGYKEHYRFSYRFGDSTVCAEAAWYNADIPFTATWRAYFENAVVIHDGEQVMAYQFDTAPRAFDVEEKVKIPTGINVPPTGMFLEELSDFLRIIGENPGGSSPRKEEILELVRILETYTADA